MPATNATSFSVEKAHHRIRVEREYAAPRQAVWAAWTEAGLIDQWWAPAPWKSQTQSIDVTPGGAHVYAMRGPEGETHWGKTEYTAVEPQSYFRGRDGFTDAAGNFKEDMPLSEWVTTFEKTGESATAVTVEITYPTQEDLDAILEMGFREGFTASLDQLETLLRESYR